MTVYVAKDGRQLGPYSLDELRRMVSLSQFTETDLAWYDGAPDWLPLSQVLRTAPPAGPLPPPVRKHSGLGITSFVIGLVCVPCWFALLVVAAVATQHGANEKDPKMIVFGLLILLGFGLNVLAAILGIVGAAQKDRKKTFSIIGISLNALQVVGMIGIIILGLALG